MRLNDYALSPVEPSLVAVIVTKGAFNMRLCVRGGFLLNSERYQGNTYVKKSWLSQIHKVASKLATRDFRGAEIVGDFGTAGGFRRLMPKDVAKLVGIRGKAEELRQAA